MSDDLKLDWHRDWLALDDQRIRHLDAYCDINRSLERRPDWFRLSGAERAEVQKLSGLTEAEALLRVLERRVKRSLRKMPLRPSWSYEAVLANLRVADRLIYPEENEIVSRLLSNAVRDMAALGEASRTTEPTTYS
jgi:hypothetical protein